MTMINPIGDRPIRGTHLEQLNDNFEDLYQKYQELVKMNRSLIFLLIKNGVIKEEQEFHDMTNAIEIADILTKN